MQARLRNADVRILVSRRVDLLRRLAEALCRPLSLSLNDRPLA